MKRSSWIYSPRTAPLLPISEPAWPFLMEAASQAPSGDNCQPWRFRLREDRLDLFLAGEADHSFFNVDQLASGIACGAAIENIVTAATAVGRQAHVTLLPDGPDEPRMASIDLEPSEVKGRNRSPLWQAIWGRSTNRKPFQRKPVLASDLQALVSAARGSDEETRLLLLTDREALGKVGQLVFSADKIRTENRGLHEYFVSMVRYSQKDALQTLDGLPLPNLEAGKAGDAFLKLTRSWAVMNGMNRMGVGNAVSLASRLGIWNCAGVGLLHGGPKGMASALGGGRALQRVWLTATKLGLQIQPMTAITLFWERWRRGGQADFSPRHQKMLARLWPTYHRLFATDPEEDRTHIMLFRFGFGSPMAYGTYRRAGSCLMWGD